jgi:hypothetical protein
MGKGEHVVSLEMLRRCCCRERVSGAHIVQTKTGTAWDEMDYEKFFRETLIQHALAPPDNVSLPVVGVDHNADQPAMGSALWRARNEKLIKRAVRLHSELRRKSDGSFLHFSGKTGHLPREEYGRAVPRFKWPDKNIALALVGCFVESDRVVLVSADTRKNVGGLTRILEREIGPALKAHHQKRFGLLTFMKKKQPSWELYAEELLIRLRSSGVDWGYEYVEV